jgi:RHS repeat-associated protein
MVYDEAGRIITETNVLGSFTRTYDGASGRMLTETSPNGMLLERGYAGNSQDRALQRITYTVGALPISEFLYNRDIAKNRITTWSQQADAATPDLYTFGYDDEDELISVTVTNSGSRVNQFGYTYDPAGNRLSEQVGPSSYSATYNALNQINTTMAPGATRTNEWDAKDRLVAVNAGNLRTEFTYDGLSRLVALRQLTNGTEISFRRFLWNGNEICEERDAGGAVTKRFFPQGVELESGPSAGKYFYTRDHLDSIHELTDGTGSVRARYSFDPFGKRTQLSGDVTADFGFTGLLFAREANLTIALFRDYDHESGRWLSRDPLRLAEMTEGPNLYAYVGNNPINSYDRLGLAQDGDCCTGKLRLLSKLRNSCPQARANTAMNCSLAASRFPELANEMCQKERGEADRLCGQGWQEAVRNYARQYATCLRLRPECWQLGIMRKACSGTAAPSLTPGGPSGASGTSPQGQPAQPQPNEPPPCYALPIWLWQCLPTLW